MTTNEEYRNLLRSQLDRNGLVHSRSGDLLLLG